MAADGEKKGLRTPDSRDGRKERTRAQEAGERDRRRDEKGVESGSGPRGKSERVRVRGRGPLNPLGEAGLRKKKICHGQASRFLDFRVFSNPRSENSRAGRKGGTTADGGGRVEGGVEMSREEEIEYPSCEPFESVALFE